MQLSAARAKSASEMPGPYVVHSFLPLLLLLLLLLKSAADGAAAAEIC
jgi:acyl dehydratase